MFPRKTQFVAAIWMVLALAGCGRRVPPPEAQSPADGSSRAAGFLSPPMISQARRQGATVVLSGVAPSDARVRLATPAGEARVVKADGEGRWSLTLGPAAAPRIFGLSALVGAQAVQAQGYVLVAPGGATALLRAGAGSLRLDPLRPGQIGAVDFDRGGGVIISGVASASAPLSIRVDGRQAADGQAGADGRFSIVLPQPLAAGPHRIELIGDAVDTVVEVNTDAPGPLVDGPMHSQLSPGGLRVDWLTPGGGVQSTLLVG